MVPYKIPTLINDFKTGISKKKGTVPSGFLLGLSKLSKPVLSNFDDPTCFPIVLLESGIYERVQLSIRLCSQHHKIRIMKSEK